MINIFIIDPRIADCKDITLSNFVFGNKYFTVFLQNWLLQYRRG